MTRRAVPALLLAGLVLALLHLPGRAAAAPAVVATIKPVHSLVAGVMAGIGEPGLLVRGGGSPHSFSLRPSDAAAIAGADLVFWIGPELETFLQAPLRKLAPEARLVPLAAAPGIRLLPVREGGIWGTHEHGEHGDDGHHGEGGHGEGGGHDHGHASGQGQGPHHDDDGHGAMDMHVWLDPVNARAMTAAIAAALAEADPANADAYRANAAALSARLEALEAELRQLLAPVADRPFVLFHDAFQYMEHAFGLQAVGSVTASPERQPGVERLSELRRTIRERGAVCIFAEPQFPPRLLQVVAEGGALRSGVLDPLGAELEDGPELYFALLRGNARSLADCLSTTG